MSNHSPTYSGNARRTSGGRAWGLSPLVVSAARYRRTPFALVYPLSHPSLRPSRSALGSIGVVAIVLAVDGYSASVGFPRISLRLHSDIFGSARVSLRLLSDLSSAPLGSLFGSTRISSALLGSLFGYSRISFGYARISFRLRSALFSAVFRSALSDFSSKFECKMIVVYRTCMFVWYHLRSSCTSVRIAKGAI